MSETVRALQVAVIEQILREQGIDPMPLKHEAGLAPEDGRDLETLVPLLPTMRFAVLAERRLGLPDIGLLIGERAAALGLDALLAPARACPDVRSALHLIATVLQRYRRGIVLHTEEQDGTATVELRQTVPEVVGSRIHKDGAIVMVMAGLRRFAGPDFRLSEARFAYSRPADLSRHRRIFGAPLVFDAEEFALVMEAAWLDRKMDGGSPDLRGPMGTLPSMTAAPAQSLASDVAYLLLGDAGVGRAAQDAVARRLGMGVRVLHRRLVAEGTSFNAIRTRIRHERACYLLRMTGMSMAQIAQALDYSEASAFTRAFRHEAGCSPTEWRERQRGD